MPVALKKLTESDFAQNALWAVAFVGVCTLVGLGKLKPETVEYMLFALVGRAAYVKGSSTKGKTDENVSG